MPEGNPYGVHLSHYEENTMQTAISKPASVFSSIRIHLLKGADKAKAMASCVVSNAIMITGIRIVEGPKGIFVSMPQRRSPQGEYSDVAFPISKEMRLELTRLVLDEFERSAHAVTEAPQGNLAAA